MRLSHRQYFLFLAAIFAVIWIALAIDPLFGSGWLLTGHSLNGAMGWERDHFDRLVHFSCGLLPA